MPAKAVRLEVVVYGAPAAQGSKRHVGGGRMVESSRKVAPWRDDVRQAAIRAMTTAPTWDVTTREVIMHVRFTLPRPASHYRTGRFSHLLRDNAPTHVSTKPDLDKLLRSTCDALTSAGVYADDSRVVAIHASKAYPTTDPRAHMGLDRPGAHIVLEAWKGTA